MSLPSLSGGPWRDGNPTKPSIQVLVIRHHDHPTGEPIAHLLLERQEVNERNSDGKAVEGPSLSLYYQRIMPKYSSGDIDHGCFNGSYSASSNAVSITSASMSEGYVTLDLPGLEDQRIGTYLMNEVVKWVRQWPEATVNCVALLPAQGHGPNRGRRNRFYEQFDLVFDYDDPAHTTGRSRPMLAKALTPLKDEDRPPNISEHLMFDYLGEVRLAEQTATSELAARDRACADLIRSQRKAEAHPVWWALQQIYFRYAASLVGAALLLGLGALVWAKLSG